MRIGLFVTCLTDTLYPDTGKAVVTVLERLGHRVDFPAGQSCCGQMHFNTGYRRAVAESAPRTHELSVFLADVLGVTDGGAYFPHKVTYHPTCHGLRMLKVGDAPLRLLRAVRGLNLADLPDAEACCGFGGTFAVKNADVSAAICADKVAAVRMSGAEVLCAADNSCLMHIGGALDRQRSGVAVMHLAEILARTDGESR